MGGRLAFRAFRVPAGTGMDGKDLVRIDVEDQGHGIDPEHLDHIFEPFYTTKGDKGNGLGLAMVYSLVKQLHGDIQVHARPTGGTCFSLFFPAASLDKGKRLPTDTPKPLPPGKGRLLLVEDDERVRLVSERTLQALGYEVLSAGDGHEGLARLREQADTLQAVVSDILMPRMGGPEMIRKARAEGFRPPVLFITGYGHQTLGDLLDEPDVFLLYKPYSREDLGRVLAEILPPSPTASGIKPV